MRTKMGQNAREWAKEKFEINIPDEEAEKIQTVGMAIDYIKEHLDSN